MSGEINTAYRPLTAWVAIVHGVYTLLYGRQRSCFHFYVSLLPRCIRIIGDSCSSLEELKITSPQIEQQRYNQQAANSLWGGKNPQRIKCCQLPAQIWHKVHANVQNVTEKLVVISQHSPADTRSVSFIQCCSLFRFKSFMIQLLLCSCQTEWWIEAFGVDA